MSAVPASLKVHIVRDDGRILCTSQKPLQHRLIALPFNAWRTHPEHARCKRCLSLLTKSRREAIECEAWRLQVLDLTGETRRVVFEVLCSHAQAEDVVRDSLRRQRSQLQIGQRLELQRRVAGKHRFQTVEVYYMTKCGEGAGPAEWVRFS